MKTVTNLQFLPEGFGHYRIKIKIDYENNYSAVTNNMTLIDNIHRDDENSEEAKMDAVKFVLDQNDVEYDEIEIL
jgi:hypothetical protein